MTESKPGFKLKKQMLVLNVKDADHPQFWGSVSSEYLPISAVTKAGLCKTWDKDFAVWIMFSYYFLLSHSFKGRLGLAVKYTMQRAAEPSKLRAESSEMLTYIKALFSQKSRAVVLSLAYMWCYSWLATCYWQQNGSCSELCISAQEPAPSPAHSLQCKYIEVFFHTLCNCSAVQSRKGEYFQLFERFWAWGYDCFWVKRELGYH